jgi:hypothetical protein
MPTDKYPHWAEPAYVNELECDIDNHITQYAMMHGYKLNAKELRDVAAATMAAVYAAVEAQVEIAVNRRAYAKI